MAHPPREAVCARGNRGPAHQNCESCVPYCFPFVDAPACSCLRQYRSRTGRSRLFSQRCSSSSEGVAFPTADRVAIPRGLSEINRQLPPVGVNLPVLWNSSMNAKIAFRNSAPTRSGHAGVVTSDSAVVLALVATNAENTDQGKHYA